MYLFLVNIHVKPDKVEAFRAATLDNARNSILEPGIARFDIIQQADDPTRFVLVEAYRSADAQAKHRETAHYARWRDAVADLLAEPRTGIKYNFISPENADRE